jgi:hypothetical protein
MARMTSEQIADHEAKAALRAAERKAGRTVGEVTPVEAVFDKHHLRRETMEAKGLERQLALDLKAAQKAGRIGFWERSKILGFRNTVGKPALIGAGILAGIGAIGLFAHSLRKNRSQDTHDEIAMAGALPPPVAMDPMVGQNTLMGQVPTPGDRAAAVLASRGAGSPNLPGA